MINSNLKSYHMGSLLQYLLYAFLLDGAGDEGDGEENSE